jgi:hypothetical protein
MLWDVSVAQVTNARLILAVAGNTKGHDRQCCESRLRESLLLLSSLSKGFDMGRKFIRKSVHCWARKTLLEYSTCLD